MEYIYQNETYAIRGCMKAVFSELGNGYLEKVYQEALELEFQEAGIPYQREVRLNINIKEKLSSKNILQILCVMKRLLSS